MRRNIGAFFATWRLLVRLRLPCLPLALLAIVLIPESAYAHAFLVSTTPQQGERLTEPPASVGLRFSEPVIPDSAEVRIRTSEGGSVDGGRLQRQPDGLGVELPLPRLREGVYVVSWRSVSAVDGHEEAGEFAFAVGGGGRLPIARTGGKIGWPGAAAGWLALAGLLTAFGGLASERWIWRRAADGHGDWPRLPVGWLVVAGVTGSAAQLVLNVASAGRPARVALLTTRPVLLLVVQLVVGAYALWLLALPRLRPWAMVPLGAALVVAALRGHPGSGPSAWWSAPVNGVHLAAVGLWLGGLGHVLLVLRGVRESHAHEHVAEGVRRYAGLALVAVAVAVGSGVLTALSQLDHPAQLIGSTYGLILLAKLALVSLALLLAFLARSRGILGKAGVRRRLVLRLVRPEAALVVMAVGAASTLAAAPPPRADATVAELLGPPPLKGPSIRLADLAGSLAVHLAAADGRLQVRVISPSREPALAEIAIEGRRPDGRGFRVSPRPCGVGCVTSAFRWCDGSTSVSVRVGSREWGEGTVAFRVPWRPRPADASLIRRTVAAMRRQPMVRITEVVTSGPGARAENRTTVPGKAFMDLEVYSRGEVTEVRPLPPRDGATAFTAFLPGSWIWLLLETDEHDRLVHETIVSPGHRIVRRFTYEDSGEF